MQVIGLEFNGNPGTQRLPDMYGKWKHVVFQYDEKSSEVAFFIDGNKLNLPDNIAKRTKDGLPLGPLKLANASKLILGGFQQHGGVSGNPDDWMGKFTGKLDQFRLYTTALSATEVKKLYTDKL